MKDRNYFAAELGALINHASRILHELEVKPDSTAPDDFKAEAPDSLGFREPPPERRGDPAAKTVADMVTPKQLGLIRALGREKGVDHEFECQQMHGCLPEDLSKRAASQLIDHLQKLEPEFKVKRAG